MKNTNEMEMIFDSRSSNEGFATCGSGIIYDAAKSDSGRSVGCKNSYIGGSNECALSMDMKMKYIKFPFAVRLKGRQILCDSRDQGKGIENVEQAMQPMYTTKPELERSGMGFAFMEAFMDQCRSGIQSREKERR